MATNPNSIVQEAVDAAISERGEIGLQVTAYVDGKQVVDVWSGLADATTGKKVDADTLFPVFSVTKAVTAVALHIQAERGLVDYATPIAHYWPEFGAHGKDTATVYDALTHRLGVPLMHGFLIKNLSASATPQTCWGSQRSLQVLPENSSP